MNRKIKIAALLGMGMFPFAAAYAQQDTTLNRTVVVENEYNPRVMDASKINVLPTVEEPKMMKKHIDYATTLRTLTQENPQAMPALLREWAKQRAARGYLRGGYGNKGNVEAALGYLWDISKKDRLQFDALFNGWDGTIDSEPELEWKSRFYRTLGGLDYQHQFDGMALNVGGNYQSQVFTYMPLLGAEPKTYAGHQRQTMMNVHAGMKTTDPNRSWLFDSEAGWDLFQMQHPSSLKENHVYIKGGLWKNMGEGQLLGSGLAFHHHAYSGVGTWKGTTLIKANPSYTYETEGWKIRIGAHVDWWSGVDDVFSVAPDVKVEYLMGDSYVLYARAGGGMENTSLRDWTELTPFWLETGNEGGPTDVKLDAAIGLKASPASGWWFHLTGGYQIREDDLNLVHAQGSGLTYMDLISGDNKVAYGSAELKTDLKNFGFSLKGTYYNWKWSGDAAIEEAGIQPLALRPELQAHADAWIQLMEGWKINLGYDYEKRCEDIYSAVNDLQVGATCTLFRNLEVFGRVHNLLNQSYVRPDGYSAQKLHFLAGLSFYF